MLMRKVWEPFSDMGSVTHVPGIFYFTFWKKKKKSPIFLPINFASTMFEDFVLLFA